MNDEDRILRESLRSASTLTPLIRMAATKAAHGRDIGKRYQFGETLRLARRLVAELELQQTQLGWRDEDAA